MDLSMIDKKFNNTVRLYNDGQLEPEEVAEEFVVKIVEKDKDKNDDDDDDDNNDSKKDDEQDDYYDDKDAPMEEEEEDYNEMGNNNNDDEEVDDKTMNKEDDDDKAEQEKWYYKAKFMLDWVNRFSQTHCIHPGFDISIDEMMKLFKGCSNTICVRK